MKLRSPFYTPKEEVFELLDPSGGRVREQKVPQQRLSKLDIDRKDPVLLENMYATEPILNSGISTWQLLIEDSDFEVLVDDEHTQNEIDDLLLYTTLRSEMLEKLPIQFGVYGNWWLEHIKTKNKKKIVEVVSLDPKEMMNEEAGFIKQEDSTSIALNNVGRPLGYLRYDGFGVAVPYLPPNDVSFRYYQQVTHTQLGLGFIESLYADVTLKENLEQARGQAAYNLAWPKPIVGYGSQFARATADMKSRAEKLAQQLADPDIEWVTYPMSEFKVSYPEMPEMKETIIDQLMYTTKLQAAVLRIPMAILLETGEDEGRATLETLADWFEYSFRGFQRRMKPHIVCKDILEFNAKHTRGKKLNWTGLRTEFGPITNKAKKEFVMSIQRMGKTALIDPDDPEVRKAIRKALGIKAIDEGTLRPKKTEMVFEEAVFVDDRRY